MAISETARKNHDELLPGHVSTLKVSALLLHRSPNIVPIPGTCKPERLRENLAAVSITLTMDEISDIDGTASKIRIVGGRGTGREVHGSPACRDRSHCQLTAVATRWRRAALLSVTALSREGQQPSRYHYAECPLGLVPGRSELLGLELVVVLGVAVLACSVAARRPADCAADVGGQP